LVCLALLRDVEPMPEFWDEIDRIEIPQIDRPNDSKPVPMQVKYAWPETLRAHWDRLREIREEAYQNNWRYRGKLPYRMKHLIALRRAFDGLPTMPYAEQMTKEELCTALCVDMNRRPVHFLDTLKYLDERKASSLEYRDAKVGLRKQTIDDRTRRVGTTMEALKQFRKEASGKIYVWEKRQPYGTTWYKAMSEARPLYLIKASQKVGKSEKHRNRLSLFFFDDKLRHVNITFVEFYAWMEGNTLYITEYPVVGSEKRRLPRPFRFRPIANMPRRNYDAGTKSQETSEPKD
jgi:hypothetical protein